MTVRFGNVIAAATILLFSSSVTVANSSPPPVTTSDASTDPDQKIKCRKYLAPDSLVRKIKTCKTVAEWRRAAQAGNDAARAIVGENVCSGGECRGYEPPAAPP